ncbi:MAG: hypothetical protein ACXVZM_11505, partial [Terriglobales bacterium]
MDIADVPPVAAPNHVLRMWRQRQHSWALRLPGEEGTFNMCSFWLVEALTRAGQAIPEKLERLARTLAHCILVKCGNPPDWMAAWGPQLNGNS